MSTLLLEVKAKFGCDAQDAIRDAIDLAKKIGVDITFMFNDIAIEVNEDSSVTVAYMRYNREFEEKYNDML